MPQASSTLQAGSNHEKIFYLKLDITSILLQYFYITFAENIHLPTKIHCQ
ncbi:hypothetical protein SAMN04515674_104207 [Pseudarcicella hirudinis]|uniref:Uncharacterized protein n=1 Tax=Pseudarcicella hirudinis TaxID=1079859 RepID=A0A1I5RRG5_9BACT|nr:hypothetical protein SAMN04515674_104207 [Pseudarcicella hirudinis]